MSRAPKRDDGPQDRVCAVSVDLDPLRCYYGIHGIGLPPDELAHVILRRGLPRFVEILERRGISATFFVVGEDLDRDAAGRALLKDVATAGHELGNHSQSHRYELARLGPVDVRSEIGRAHDRIAELTGRAPVGFRAPGYDLSSTIVKALVDLGYAYDSSIFSAPIYWAAKAAIMGVMSAGGRRSGAVLGDPRALLAPLLPYRPSVDAPWRRGQASIVELPVSVTKGLRVPVFGTSLLLAPTAVRARLLESMRARSFFNFELHGIDLVDADLDGIPAELVEHEVALRTPLDVKRRALEATLDRLTPDFRFATLREVASEVQRGRHLT